MCLQLQFTIQSGVTSFHLHEVMSCYRDPQLPVRENLNTIIIYLVI